MSLMQQKRSFISLWLLMLLINKSNKQSVDNYIFKILGVLSSVLHQKPEDRTVEMVVKNKLDFCLSRSKALHQKIIND